MRASLAKTISFGFFTLTFASCDSDVGFQHMRTFDEDTFYQVNSVVLTPDLYSDANAEIYDRYADSLFKVYRKDSVDLEIAFIERQWNVDSLEMERGMGWHFSSTNWYEYIHVRYLFYPRTKGRCSKYVYTRTRKGIVQKFQCPD